MNTTSLTRSESVLKTPHPPVTRALTADDINWDPAPVRIETTDLLAEALLDAESYRAVAQEALHALARLTTQHRRLVQVHRHLREQYRALLGKPR